MIGFEPVPEPVDFQDRGRAPGTAWLAAHPDARRPRDYWTPFRGALASGFRDLCAYSAMFEPVGTVDHFVSWHEDRSRAYDWENYRYCSGWINASKQKALSADLIDPFEIGDGWFEILLPSLQLRVSDTIPDEFRKRAEYTLKRLHLRDDERVLRQRQEWCRMYQSGELTLDALKKKAPLIAMAIEEQDNLGNGPRAG